VKIQELKEAGKDPIILDAGDLFFSTKKLDAVNRRSEEYRAKSILKGYNKIGCDAINVGHYEMLNGLKFLRNLTKTTDIPFISANLRSAKSNELLFQPYHIIEREKIKFGVIGLTSMLPDTCKSIVADDYITVGNQYIDELSKNTDIIIMLVNAERSAQSDLVANFPNADFIITSGSNNMSRHNSPQKTGGPYIYSCGKQGKYLLVLDADLKNKNEPMVDVSGHQKKIDDIKKRFKRLQKKDPSKSLEDIYSKQENILKIINQYRTDLKESELAVANAVNTVQFKTIALNNKIQDDPDILSFVDLSIKTCNSLNPETLSKSKSEKNKVKAKKTDHSGHKH